MKNHITKLINDYVKEYMKQDNVETQWQEPLVGFADANHPEILGLKKLISPNHALPVDVIPDASIVIAYFVPFTKELAETNRIPSEIASPEWARSYEETNAMFVKLNAHIINHLKDLGYHAGVSPEATTFQKQTLMSNWSQRHFAKVAGLGTFGINNMLITKKGCCGRYNTVVTNLKVEPNRPQIDEYCLYKKNKTCGVCVKRCPSGALTLEGFDRHKCYELLQKNALRYTKFGSSYTTEDGSTSNSKGSDVCGKCVVGAPCTFINEAKNNEKIKQERLC